MTDTTKIAAALKQTLADTYAVYMKTHGYHWNVTGVQFHSLHTMFETQYTEMWMALDEIAERVRAVGDFAPGSGQALASLSIVEEQDASVPRATEMLKHWSRITKN
ncbi:MAG: DNA starvation/stationary phase protection protein [Parvularculaceae bacterium]